MTEDRPNPEDLLKAISREEREEKKGHLKIFLGMSAGVGKTYAMLAEAQKKQSEGVNVLIGSVNTHGRKETAHLLEGLKVIPEKWISYKDTVFEELDLDGILKQKPQLVIVDELAHSNVPGSRHPKRWQDVIEILDAGIDVYTTLNVQHIESLRDVIENIAGITIRETVPDLILESASQIVLVDITPEGLLARLKEGKVYLGDQSKIAAQNFFQEDRLTALREIVLRFAAEKVDHDLQEMISTVERAEGWRPREKLLVAVSHSPHSQKLIRNTRRLAFNLDAPWIALNINTGEDLEEKEAETLDQNLSLARELGAEVITIDDPDIIQGILRVARQKGVTQIVIGRAPKNFFTNLFRASLVDRLAREVVDIDLHVIRQATLEPQPIKIGHLRFKDRLSSYFMVACYVAVLSLLNFLLLPYHGYLVSGFIFLIGILLQSLFSTRWPILFGACLCAVVWIFFFIPSHYFFPTLTFEDSSVVVLFLLTGLITGVLNQRSRKREALLLKREEATQAIYEIVRDIASAPSLDQILARVKGHLGSILNGSCDILLKQLDTNQLGFEESFLLADDKEKGIAKWVFENGKEAGWSTSTLPESRNLYLPLKSYKEILGVLAYHPNLKKALNPEELNFLYTVTQQLATYLQRRFDEERAHKQEQMVQIEKIYQTILKTISREFYHPLLSIDQAVEELKSQQKRGGPSGSWQIHKIKSSSENLIRTVKNISAMAKLSVGLVSPHREKNSIEKLIFSCVDNVDKWLKQQNIKVDIQKNIPLINFDFSLMEILLYNLLFNAIEFSPPNTTIEVEAKIVGNSLILSVMDEGPGIPENMLKSVFEKFYQIPGRHSSGMGLGLAIAKTIADIHKGQLIVENRKERGAKFSLYLPIKPESIVK